MNVCSPTHMTHRTTCLAIANGMERSVSRQDYLCNIVYSHIAKMLLWIRWSTGCRWIGPYAVLHARSLPMMLHVCSYPLCTVTHVIPPYWWKSVPWNQNSVYVEYIPSHTFVEHSLKSGWSSWKWLCYWTMWTRRSYRCTVKEGSITGEPRKYSPVGNAPG